MNATYSTYLQSEAWDQKRSQRLALAGGKCEACGVSRNIQVHHLTYARIFQEEMEDLLCLCKIHHDAVEELVLKKILPRTGDVRWLREQTLRFIAPKKLKKDTVDRSTVVGDTPTEPRIVLSLKAANKRMSPQMVRHYLTSDPRFVELLKLSNREAFRIAARKLIGTGKMRNRLMSNAMLVYDQHPNRFLPRWKPNPDKRTNEYLGEPTGIPGEYYMPQ